jgi:uncharacterized iron-regulated membrane protein
MAPLDLATLAMRAEAQEPHARVGYFAIVPGLGHVMIAMGPRTDPRTGKPYVLPFYHVFLDPYTGRELGRRRDGDLSQGRINIMPFLFDLHTSLAAGSGGALVLGIVALAWTIDCFVGFYLTLPRGLAKFVRHWKPAWLLKWQASVFRLQFDLHRASGLWLWPLLFVFAWSSVMFNLSSVYDGVTGLVLGRAPMSAMFATLHPHRENTHPKLGWREAQAQGGKLMAAIAKARGMHIIRPFGIGYIEQFGVYTYDVRADSDVGARTWESGLWLDGDTGALQKIFTPYDGRPGDRVTTWLYALHWADFHDRVVYRVFVALLGVAIAGLSGTGVYIWLVKRRARSMRKAALAVRTAGTRAQTLQEMDQLVSRVIS